MEKIDILMKFEYGKYYIIIKEDLNLSNLKCIGEGDIYYKITKYSSLYPTSYKEKLMTVDEDNDILFYYLDNTCQSYLIEGKYEISEELFGRLFNILKTFKSINLTVEYWFKNSMFISYNSKLDTFELVVKENISDEDYFISSYDIYTSNNMEDIGRYSDFWGGVFLLNGENLIIKCKKVIDMLSFNTLKKVFTNYKYNGKNEKFFIEYEMIKLENPIKNKSYLFRLKDNNIPKDWIKKSDYLIKRLENLNSKYGNISQNKVNLIDFNGYIPKNIDFVISEIYAKRVDELFKSWNNNNKKSNKMELVEFLFREYNQINSYGDNYFIILNDKITVLVNAEELKILEFKTMYYNIDMVSYSKLVECVNNIQKEIDRINEKRVDN